MTFARRAGTVVLAAVFSPMALCACKSAPAAEPAIEGAAQPTKAVANPSAFPVNHEAWAKFGYRLDWVGFPFPRQGRAPKVVALKGFDDVVLAQEGDTTVTVLETATGQRRWSTDLTGPLTRFVSLDRDALDPSRVVLSSESEAFVLSIPNGNMLGRERFDRVVNTRAVMAGPIAIYGTSKGEILAHRLGLGVKAWGFGTNNPIDAAPIVVGSSILTVNQAGEVTALTSEGNLQGRNRIFGGTSTDPVTNGTLVFIAGLDQSLWAFDEIASLAWRYRTPGPLRTQPAAFGDRVYVEVRNQGLTALTAADGTVVWSSKDASGTVIASREREVLAWNAETSTMTLLEAERGEVIHTVAMPGVRQIFTDDTANAPMYAVSDKGVVARFVKK